MMGYQEVHWVPFDYEEVACATNSTGTLTAAKITLLKGQEGHYKARVFVADYPVAWREDGGAATTATKNYTAVGASFELWSLKSMDKFNGAGVGGQANLGVTYFKGV